MGCLLCKNVQIYGPGVVCKTLGSLDSFGSNLEQFSSRTKLIPPHIPECSASTNVPHSPFIIVPRFTAGVLI